jgi:hypothetical protein
VKGELLAIGRKVETLYCEAATLRANLESAGYVTANLHQRYRWQGRRIFTSSILAAMHPAPPRCRRPLRSIGEVSSGGFSRTPRPSCSNKTVRLAATAFPRSQARRAESSVPETSDLGFRRLREHPLIGVKSITPADTEPRLGRVSRLSSADTITGKTRGKN